jgi:hypothetical protein
MRMMRSAIVAIAAGATLLTMAPAAQADTVNAADNRGDAPRKIDLTRARIDNGDTRPRLVLIRLGIAGRWRLGGDVTVWFNLDRSNPGPELRFTGVLFSAYALQRVNGWNGTGHETSCDDYDMKQIGHNRAMRVRIKRACLGHRPVRVAVRTRSGDGDTDWFGHRRTFLPAVRH